MLRISYRSEWRIVCLAYRLNTASVGNRLLQFKLQRKIKPQLIGSLNALVWQVSGIRMHMVHRDHTIERNICSDVIELSTLNRHLGWWTFVHERWRCSRWWVGFIPLGRLTSQYSSIDWTQPTTCQVVSQLGKMFGSWNHEWENSTRDEPRPGQLFRPLLGLISRPFATTPMDEYQWCLSPVSLSYGLTVSCAYIQVVCSAQSIERHCDASLSWKWHKSHREPLHPSLIDRWYTYESDGP